MAYKSWSNATKKESTGEGTSVKRVKLETGKPFRFAILSDPYDFHQHMLKGKRDGKDAWRSIRCDEKDCPICQAGKYKATRRFAFNVLDMEANEVAVLEVGATVIQQIEAMAQMGIDPLTVTWMINKTGTGTNTAYAVMQMGNHNYNVAMYEADLYDLDELYAPHTMDKAKEIAEQIGITWDELTTEEQFRVPTLAEAKKMIVTFGKHKGRTLGDIYADDRSANGWINWFAFKTRPSELRNGARVILSEEGGLHFDDLNP